MNIHCMAYKQLCITLRFSNHKGILNLAYFEFRFYNFGHLLIRAVIAEDLHNVVRVTEASCKIHFKIVVILTG